MKRLITLLLALCLSAVGFAAAGTPGMVLAMATPASDVDAIAKWAGKYDRTMIAQMLNGLDVFQDLTVDRNISRKGKLLPKFKAEPGVRPLDLTVERNNRKERSLGGRMLYVYDCMKLFNFVPEELTEAFLGDMISPGAPDIPFAQWFWQREMDKLASEINDNFYNSEYHADADDWASGDTYAVGDYVKFTDDNYYKCVDATTAGQSPTTHPAKWQESNALVTFDGPAKIIADEITASNITPITTGALSEANALDKIELMYKSMTDAHRKQGGVFLVSYDIWFKYIKHEQDVFKYTNDSSAGDGKKYVYGSNKKFEIRPTSWMNGTNRVIVDLNMPSGNRNLRAGTTIAGASAPSIGKVVPTVHGYLTSAKYLLGFQIADLEPLYVNDQA